MYRLYWWRCTGAFAPEAVMREIGLEFERLEVDTAAGDHLKPDFLAINPRGQLPALQLPDGSLMTESAAMVLHLSEQHPQAALLPPVGSSERGQLLRWLVFAVANLYEADLRWEYCERYTADPAGGQAVREQAGIALNRDWGTIEEAADAHGPWFFGASFSALDIYLAMLAGWHFEPSQLFRDCPRVARLTRALAERPAIAPVWQEHYSHKKLFES